MEANMKFHPLNSLRYRHWIVKICDPGTSVCDTIGNAQIVVLLLLSDHFTFFPIHCPL